MSDGRSHAPAPPPELDWFFLTRAINHYLGTAYSVDEVMLLPGDQLTMLEALLEQVE